MISKKLCFLYSEHPPKRNFVELIKHFDFEDQTEKCFDIKYVFLYYLICNHVLNQMYIN